VLGIAFPGVDTAGGRAPVEDESRQQNAEVVGRLFAHINSRDFDAALDLFDDDLVWEMPYAPPGLPAPFDLERTGKLLRGFPKVFAEGLIVHDVTVSPMLDPDQLLAEYRGEAVMAATGEPYRNRYVAIFRFSDHRIVGWREYFDSAVAIRAFGWPSD
jgi:ketosteroid isomerase-like protein